MGVGSLALAASCARGGDVPAPRASLAGYAAYDPTADGARQIEAAAAAARTSGRRVLVVFGGNWCVWCRALDTLLATDPGIRAQLHKAFVLVHVDSEANLALNQRYGNPFQHGFPVLLVLGGAGELLHVQETGSWERRDEATGHDPGRVLAFLQRWGPPGI